VVERGEVSLVLFRGPIQPRRPETCNGRRIPGAEGFRRRRDDDHALTGVRAFADRVAATVPSSALYARVDLVDTDRGPMLMELELIEPETLFLYVPDAARRLADSDRRPTRVISAHARCCAAPGDVRCAGVRAGPAGRGDARMGSPRSTPIVSASMTRALDRIGAWSFDQLDRTSGLSTCW
jgi:hypothetical protein